ncbi:MAG TPA: thioredoxin domain-containing protein [Flavobacteriales bacterium]|nr:thioredoxin domain-containing protein [Flavobacteriales bacterium]HRJ35969.1 thioredoxin domain-containing protein [Flavobacteriales bacterium]HRJ39192.1 thioredoxin domain-containing protein [Flavobacteriales bacterium]
MVRFITLVNLLFWAGQIQAQGIPFHKGDFASAQAIAKSEGKLIFVDFYATWCAPCKFMANQIFPDTILQNYFTANFISLQIDAERQERELLNRVNVEAYPTLVFFQADGKVIYHSKGAMDAPTLLETATMVREYEKNKKAYEKNPSNLRSLSLYLTVLSHSDPIQARSIALKHLSSITTEKCTIPENWSLIRSFDRDPDSRFFLYSLENFRFFVEQMPGYQEYFTGCAGLIIERAVELRDEKLVQRYKDVATAAIGKMNMPVSESFLYEIDAYYYSQTGQRDKHLASLDQWMMDPITNAGVICNTVFETVDRYGVDAYPFTLKWAQRAVEMEKSFFTLMTLATVYRSKGMKKEALQTAESAQKLAGPEDDINFYESFIQEVNQMK